MCTQVTLFVLAVCFSFINPQINCLIFSSYIQCAFIYLFIFFVRDELVNICTVVARAPSMPEM